MKLMVLFSVLGLFFSVPAEAAPLPISCSIQKGVLFFPDYLLINVTSRPEMFRVSGKDQTSSTIRICRSAPCPQDPQPKGKILRWQELIREIDSGNDTRIFVDELTQGQELHLTIERQTMPGTAVYRALLKYKNSKSQQVAEYVCGGLKHDPWD